MALIKIQDKAIIQGKTVFSGGPTAASTAEAYIAAVEEADGESLESGVATAYTDFITGLWADGLWDSLKASCILAGARTLAGALVPLVGTAPTNNNFVSADYNRETGLLGNGTTKYLNSNRAGNADPQNDAHISIYMPQLPIGQRIPFGYSSSSSSSNLVLANTYFFPRVNNNTSSGSNTGSVTPTGFYGASRSSSSSYSYLRAADSSTTSLSIASGTPPSINYYVQANNNNGSLSYVSNGRMSFYSIGEAIDLVKLKSRVDTLMTDLAAAI